MAFVVEEHEEPAVEVRVNFGVFAGREATPAELDRLAEWLLDEVDDILIISEDRHEIDEHVEASVHQVLICVAEAGHDREQLAERIRDRADHWARLCVAERHADVADV
jgi:hypothetical protein